MIFNHMLQILNLTFPKKSSSNRHLTMQKLYFDLLRFSFFSLSIVNFPFLDGDVTRSPSYSVYNSQLIRFVRACSNVNDVNNRNLFLTAKSSKQGYRYHKIRRAFSKFYHRNSELIV